MYDHEYIESHQIIDRYVMGKLSASERTEFDNHYLNCSQCLDQLELTESFQRDLKKAVAEEAVVRTVQAGFLSWLIRSRALRGVVILACFVLILGAILMKPPARVIDPPAYSLPPVERAQEEPLPVIVFPQSVDEVILEQDVFTNEYTRFRVTVSEPGGRQVWQDYILVRRGRLEVRLPREPFTRSEYRLVLDVEDRGGYTAFDEHDLLIEKK